jgi:hypothetical protein
VLIEPPRDVEPLQLCGGVPAGGVDERLSEVSVVGTGVGPVVLLAGVEEQIEDGGDGDPVRLRRVNPEPRSSTRGGFS